MSLTGYGLVIAVSLFVGTMALLEVGRRIGVRRTARDAEGARAGTAAVEGVVFGLLGLLIAFTFSGAASRFDQRRRAMTDEANNIGTAWLRLDLLPAEAQPALREKFRHYLDIRLACHRTKSLAETRTAEAQAAKLQGEIWTLALAVCRTEAGQRWAILVLPALNNMFDIATTRVTSRRIHSPMIVFGMLGVLALVGSLLAGYGMAGARTRSWLHILGFAAIMSVTVYVILDFEFPRLGIIRIDASDQVLIDLRQNMN